MLYHLGVIVTSNGAACSNIFKERNDNDHYSRGCSVYYDFSFFFELIRLVLTIDVIVTSAGTAIVLLMLTCVDPGKHKHACS